MSRGIFPHVPKPIAERFWKHVDRRGPDECWPWMGARSCGYGRVNVGQGEIRNAHSVAWELVNGPIPNGMHVCHHCDNPPCCNPVHLWLGTPADNAHDREQKGRGGDRSLEHAPHASLTWAKVDELRKMAATGKYSVAEIARRSGLSYGWTWQIVRGRQWIAACHPGVVEADGD